MKNYYMIWTKKYYIIHIYYIMQYGINSIDREATKISALSSGEIDKSEYLTGEEILHSNWSQIMEQAKFTYSPLQKALETQT